MIARMIIKGSGSWKQKTRRLLLRLSRNNGARKSWKKRHAIVFEQHPEYRVSLSQSAEWRHRELWQPFRREKKVPVDTLKICSAISGIEDPAIIPEEIFQADIEPSLNRYSEAHFQGVKHFYTNRYPDAGFPVCYLHKIDGEWFGPALMPIDGKAFEVVLNQISYPVLVKPGIDSYGGRGVEFAEDTDILKETVECRNHVVVQQIMKQAPRIAAYHPESLNTVRVYLYRSVLDNKIHILNRALRIGNGARIDNVSAGGLVSLIRDDGQLNGFALDRYGQKFEQHPLTGVSFNGGIPKFEELNRLAKEVAGQLHLLRVVGLDLFYDKEENWRMLEINTSGHSIRFAQYAGQPFFGEFTEEVIESCKENHWALTV